MSTASLHLEAVGRTWRALRHKLTSRRTGRDCAHVHRAWRRFGARPPAVLLEGWRYCVDGCLERALHHAIERARSFSRPAATPHRIPLGLLLLSRQQLSADQLRTALQAQQAAGRGRIGEWLQSLGFVSEQQITAALARQWSCPVLRSNNSLTPPRLIPQIPVTLLEGFAMFPVNYVEATATLHMAFCEGIDHSVLYAIEQMTGCHTRPCMAPPTLIRNHLRALSGRGEREAIFECFSDNAEFSRIVCSYCVRLSSPEVRIASCGSYIWVRILRRSHPPQDLLLRLSNSRLSAFPVQSAAAAI